MNSVGIFFFTNKGLLVSSEKLSKAQRYGNFLTYQNGHYDIWTDMYEPSYQKEYDYFPRGRFVFDTLNDTFVIYKDKCIKDEALSKIVLSFEGKPYRIELDEHYQCHRCNPDYVDI